ncbi:hypothetical protein M011DRAFT_484021 [Sporormia fimetaria CBS 119925]|uniref:Uncharacterized protein n=1 Tax=Sporormia fimetaria CBS 119925 TaxID=1340428 RepID=A0A6A6VHU6_9PLEO|nr:hypothetical protein M011DRAFT_484021 [Sporormia fimetaria CBS 119925]
MLFLMAVNPKLVAILKVPRDLRLGGSSTAGTDRAPTKEALRPMRDGPLIPCSIPPKRKATNTEGLAEVERLLALKREDEECDKEHEKVREHFKRQKAERQNEINTLVGRIPVEAFEAYYKDKFTREIEGPSR